MSRFRSKGDANERYLNSNTGRTAQGRCSREAWPPAGSFELARQGVCKKVFETLLSIDFLQTAGYMEISQNRGYLLGVPIVRLSSCWVCIGVPLFSGTTAQLGTMILANACPSHPGAWLWNELRVVRSKGLEIWGKLPSVGFPNRLG